MNSLSRARLLVTPWTAAYQASPSMGFSRQKYWSGVHCLLLLCLHLLSNQKKKVIAKTSVKELTHFDFFNEFYDFMIVLICNYQIQAQRD